MKKHGGFRSEKGFARNSAWFAKDLKRRRKAAKAAKQMRGKVRRGR